MKTPFSNAVQAALIAFAVGAAHAEVVVIVNKSSPIASMTPEQVSQIYLGKASVFPDGAKAFATDLPESSAVREEFYSKVTGKAPSQVKAIWARLVFGGKGSPPKEIGDAGAVKQFVAANPGAIGYVDKKALDDSVKAVLSQP
jgi:ABC-type phosphate transport system substrate-binding protein